MRFVLCAGVERVALLVGQADKLRIARHNSPFRLLDELAEHPMQKPYINDARTKMASRDYSFRDAYHGNIANYLRAVTPEEFERFIGDQSIDFDHILAENKDVLKRLKQAEDE